jgi:16S rRNA (adenine1518-N6/adenine1519-N6)-dimethyltransferase
MPLAQICMEKKARLVAVERDERLADELRASLDAAGAEAVEIVSGDVLDVLPAVISKHRNIKTSKFIIVGNIPYYITGHLLRIVGELDPRPEACVFMVQKEVAERIVATPPDMNRLAASIQIWGEPKIIAKVPRGSFIPPPKVDSAVIVIKTKTGGAPVDMKRYYSAMHALFAQPRKTVLNNLMSYELGAMSYDGEKTGRGIEKKDIEAKIREIGIDPGARPQNLLIESIVSIAKSLF